MAAADAAVTPGGDGGVEKGLGNVRWMLFSYVLGEVEGFFLTIVRFELSFREFQEGGLMGMDD